MIKALRNWLVADPRPETAVIVPPGLPSHESATYNPLLHETGRSFPVTATELPTMALWRVRVGETVADFGVDATAVPNNLTAGYTLHRVIAQGGFGEIWEATQETLGRTVAVKRLRQDLIDQHQNDPESLQRLETAFRQEALVAAYLEHPNILPVHDLGQDAAGHLLLATKLVRGKPWDILIAMERQLPVPEFLDRHLPILEALAQAVAFSHSRGVIHRDLKPPQVMVGEFGEVLLMDWGIAMFTAENPLIAPDIDPAIRRLAPTPLTASNPAGTVAYMAPEQTESTVKNVGPWTDIYLLGGILYELLTSRSPHDSNSRHQSFFKAAVGLVQNPWEAAPNREIPDELAELALACLEPQTSRRLSSAEEFIARLKAYRTSASRRLEAMDLVRRVTADADPSADYRALTHDQALVARALSLWPGFGEAERLHEVLTLRHGRLALANMDLKLARLQVERLPEEHPERLAILTEVTRLENEQARARERLDQAYARARVAHVRADRLVTFLLDDLHSSLQQVNRLDLLAKVGREAIEYFESFAEEEPTAESMAKRALACRNIGDVFRDQGHLEEAAAAFRNFQDIALRLRLLQPTERQWKCLAAWANERLSGVEYLKGHMADALRLLDESLAIVATMPTAWRSDAEEEFLFARLTHQKGLVQWRRRELTPAMELQTRSLALHQRLTADHPGRTEFRAAVAWNMATLANVFRDLGNLPEAIARTEQGLALRRELSFADPDNKTLLDDYCWSVTNLALLREYTGAFEEALRLFEEAGEIRRRLVKGDPTNAVHRNKLAFILSSRGRNLFGLRRYVDAAEVTAEACAISRHLVEADPANLHELGGHALNLGYAGNVEIALNNWDAAREMLAEAQPAARQSLQAVPENGVFQNAWCQSLIIEGLLAEHDEDPDRARLCWTEALELLEKQSWRRTTGQGVGMHFELSVYLGREDDVQKGAEELRKNSWMMPRWERMIGPKRGRSSRDTRA